MFPIAHDQTKIVSMLIINISVTIKIIHFTTSDISELFYIKFGPILKYHKWYLYQISRTIHAITCFNITT